MTFRWMALMGRKVALQESVYSTVTDTGWHIEPAVNANTQDIEVSITQEGALTVLRLNPAPFANVGTLARVEGASTEMPKFRSEDLLRTSI